MALTGNPLLKLLVVPVVIGAILIGVSMMGKKESAQSQGAATPTVTSEEAATPWASTATRPPTHYAPSWRKAGSSRTRSAR